MKKTAIIILIILVLAILGVSYYKSTVVAEVNSFADCEKAGYAIMESYPRQCRTPDGRSFVEEIVDDKSDLIRVSNIKSGDTIKSPLVIEGEARGNWFFEASFPVKLFDGAGNPILLNPPYIMATSEWMTTEFVPFRAELTFVSPGSGAGTLVLEKDNPSGLPENDNSLMIPVVFGKGSTSVGACKPTGCSGQICSDKDMVTTCEFREEYACYSKAKCERQVSGQCGWTETAEYTQCLSNLN